MLTFLRNLFPLTQAIRSPGWRELREQHLKTHWSCVACGTRKSLNVHHVKPVALFPELELDPDNLITLCERDHLHIGHLGDWQAWNPHVWQHALIVRDWRAQRLYARAN